MCMFCWLQHRHHNIKPRSLSFHSPQAQKAMELTYCSGIICYLLFHSFKFILLYKMAIVRICHAFAPGPLHMCTSFSSPRKLTLHKTLSCHQWLCGISCGPPPPASQSQSLHHLCAVIPQFLYFVITC